MNIDIPEVATLPQHARFFRTDERDFIEVSFVGAKDTVVRKVKPEHMAAFPSEWASYCDGTPMKQREGTPLTAVMNDQQAEHYISRNVHNAEELSALHDGQCQALGHGTLTLRKAARDMLALREMKARETSRNQITRESASIGAVPAEQYASASDLSEVKTQLADLSQNVAALVAALAPKKPGRPKKVEE